LASRSGWDIETGFRCKTLECTSSAGAGALLQHPQSQFRTENETKDHRTEDDQTKDHKTKDEVRHVYQVR